MYVSKSGILLTRPSTIFVVSLRISPKPNGVCSDNKVGYNKEKDTTRSSDRVRELFNIHECTTSLVKTESEFAYV